MKSLLWSVHAIIFASFSGYLLSLLLTNNFSHCVNDSDCKIGSAVGFVGFFVMAVISIKGAINSSKRFESKLRSYRK